MIKPENYDEVEAVIAILWDDDPSTEGQTKQRVRHLCEKRITEMRQETP